MAQWNAAGFLSHCTVAHPVHAGTKSPTPRCAQKGTLPRLPPGHPTPVFSKYNKPVLMLTVLSWVAPKLCSGNEAACSLNCPRGTIHLSHVLTGNYFPSMQKMFFHCYCQNCLLSCMKCVNISQNYKLRKKHILNTCHRVVLRQTYPLLMPCSHTLQGTIL